MNRLWIAFGALAGLGAVGLSAWVAHALPARLDAAGIEAIRSGITMQGWHALALLAVGLFAERNPGVLPHVAGTAFTLGMLLFCGAVYASTLLGLRLGPIAPLGGSLLMLGWLVLFAAALKPA